MFPELRIARKLESSVVATPWGMDTSGKLIELSGARASARLSTAVSAVHLAQLAGETTVWIQPSEGPLYPPDLEECGVDLESLVVVHVPASAGDHASFRAAEILLRSGAFGLVVIDCRQGPARTDPAWQGRLLTLSREHDSRVLLITTKSRTSDSLGPLVSLRLEPTRRSTGIGGTFEIDHHVVKNKSGAFTQELQIRRGPWGLE